MRLAFDIFCLVLLTGGIVLFISEMVPSAPPFEEDPE